MDALSPTADALYAAMSQSGTLLPAFLITDANRDAQRRQLERLAGLVGLASANGAALDIASLTPDALYGALDGVMGLEGSGIYSFSELLEALEESHERAINPPFPVPGIPTEEHPDGEPAALTFGIDLSAFDGTLSARQTRIWVDLLADTLTRTQQRFPWREGSSRDAHSEPFVPGPAPESPLG